MLSVKGCALAGVLLLCVVLQAQASQHAATLTLQFDNRQSSVLDGLKREQVINTLAQYVFLVDPMNVMVVGGIDQSGLLSGTSSVVAFRAVGPTTNDKTVLENCEENTSSRWLGLRDSVARSEVKKATDTWWPNDSVEIDKAECTAS